MDLVRQITTVATALDYLTRNLEKAEDHFDRELTRLEKALAEEKMERERLEKELITQREAYNNMVAKGSGVVLAVMSVSGLIGWGLSHLGINFNGGK